MVAGGGYPSFPKAMPWTLLTFAGDMIVAIPAIHSEPPASAVITVLDHAPRVRVGNACRLLLGVTSSDGLCQHFALDEISADAEMAIIGAPAGSVVVVEEEQGFPAMRRHAYVAWIAQVTGETPDLFS